MLAAVTSLTLLSANVVVAFAVCATLNGGCPCADHEAPDSIEAPCCCVAAEPLSDD